MPADRCRFSDECHREFKQTREAIQRIDEAIRGNGKPGLVTRMTLVEDTISSMKKLMWLVIGTAITTVGGLLLKIIFA